MFTKWNRLTHGKHPRHRHHKHPSRGAMIKTERMSHLACSMVQIQLSAQHNDSLQPTLQRREVDHPACEVGFQTPPAFWDNLSEIALTRRSLREFDRRDAAHSAPSQGELSRGKLQRPLTRQACAELKKHCLPSKSVSEFLGDSTAAVFKEIKKLATHGGPDLSHLRGVRVTLHLLAGKLISLSCSTCNLLPLPHTL